MGSGFDVLHMQGSLSGESFTLLRTWLTLREAVPPGGTKTHSSMVSPTDQMMSKYQNT